MDLGKCCPSLKLQVMDMLQLGDAVISLVLTSHADRLGRKKCLRISAVLSFITILVFISSTNYNVLLAAAILGGLNQSNDSSLVHSFLSVISPSGNEIGPFMSIELSSLSQVTDEVDRTMLLAWYNLFGSFASALGALTTGLVITFFESYYQFSLLAACKVVLVVYSLCQISLFFVFQALSDAIEVPDISAAKVKQVNPVTLFLGLHKSKWIVLKLSALFMIDSFAGSFILQSLICSWFHNVYNTPAKTLGLIIFVCNLFAGISALFAAKLANAIGLILTMVVTHLPSNILVILVPLMPTEATAIAMICARFSISQMDVPTRNAYVQGVVDDDERSAANGVTNIVRSIGASVGPLIAGLLYIQPAYRNYPFYVAGGLKIVYDLLLLASFQSVKPKSERTVELPSTLRGLASERDSLKS